MIQEEANRLTSAILNLSYSDSMDVYHGNLYFKCGISKCVIFDPKGAGKRGRRVDVIRVDMPYVKDVNLVLSMYKALFILDNPTMDKVADIIQGFDDPYIVMSRRVERGIDIPAPSEIPLEICNDRFYLYASPIYFSFRPDVSDDSGPMLYCYATGSQTSIRKLYEFTKNQSDLLNSISFKELQQLLKELGIPFGTRYED